MQRKIDEESKVLLSAIERLTALKLALGELAGVACQICRKTIPFSGHGIRPLFCWTCQLKRRKEYLHKWHQEHRLENRMYVRRHRRRKRWLPADDHEKEALRAEGSFHYPHERDQVRE